MFAEFENYKRRTAKERIELFKTASEDVMVSLLPVLDDFERALAHIDEDKEAEELRKGVLLIYQKLLTTLEQKGLAKIKVAKGEYNHSHVHSEHRDQYGYRCVELQTHLNVRSRFRLL